MTTDAKIAEEFGISPRTVKNDAAFFNAVEKICTLSAMSRQELMKKATIKDIIAIAKMNDVECMAAIEKIKSGVVVNKCEGVFPVYLKLDKETNQRLKKLSGHGSVQDFINGLINSEWERQQTN